jgi:hypothetical protein
MKKVTVSNMTSTRSGREVANQFVIRTEDGRYFQSYASTIVFIDNRGQVFLDPTYWDYSVTTGKYRNEFLREGKRETQRKIDAGIYQLKNLN